MASLFIRAGIALVVGASTGGGVAAADDPRPRPKAVEALYSCQAITDTAERLACFDKAVAEVRSADSAGEVVFADREQVKKARRGLFGLGNIRLGIFGGDGGDADGQDELKEIKAQVRAIDTRRYDRWVIVLDDGARWAQTEYARIGPRTEQSKTVTIKRGPLGSYTMVFENGTWMKVKRLL